MGGTNMTPKLEDATVEALESGLPDGTYHYHPNGGGIVQDTATVDDSCFIGPNAKVYGNAKVTE